MPAIVAANFSGRFIPPAISSSLPTRRGHEPITYAWKVMAAPGDFVHPATSARFSFTVADFREMQRTHESLRRSGFYPFVSDRHTLSPTGGIALGRVIDIIEQDGLLLGLHELVGAQARSMAHRNESSIYFEPQHRDQHGKKWPNVILHNAIIPDPVLTGLGGFFEVKPGAIAASCSSSTRVPIFRRDPLGMESVQEHARQWLQKRYGVKS